MVKGISFGWLKFQRARVALGTSPSVPSPQSRGTASRTYLFSHALLSEAEPWAVSQANSFDCSSQNKAMPKGEEYDLGGGPSLALEENFLDTVRK